jgi:hypothetical protein
MKLINLVRDTWVGPLTAGLVIGSVTFFMTMPV